MWRAGEHNGRPCTTGADCKSTICSNNKCLGRPVGADCEINWLCESNICTTIGSERKCTQKRKTGELCFSNDACASNVCKGTSCECPLQSSCVLSFDCLQGCALGQSCIARPVQGSNECNTKRPNGAICYTKEPDQCLSGYCPNTISGNSYCAPKLPGNECTDTRQCVDCCTAGVCQ